MGILESTFSNENSSGGENCEFLTKPRVVSKDDSHDVNFIKLTGISSATSSSSTAAFDIRSTRVVTAFSPCRCYDTENENNNNFHPQQNFLLSYDIRIPHQILVRSKGFESSEDEYQEHGGCLSKNRFFLDVSQADGANVATTQIGGGDEQIGTRVAEKMKFSSRGKFLAVAVCTYKTNSNFQYLIQLYQIGNEKNNFYQNTQGPKEDWKFYHNLPRTFADPILDIDFSFPPKKKQNNNSSSRFLAAISKNVLVVYKIPDVDDDHDSSSREKDKKDEIKFVCDSSNASSGTSFYESEQLLNYDFDDDGKLFSCRFCPLPSSENILVVSSSTCLHFFNVTTAAAGEEENNKEKKNIFIKKIKLLSEEDEMIYQKTYGTRKSRFHTEVRWMVSSENSQKEKNNQQQQQKRHLIVNCAMDATIRIIDFEDGKILRKIPYGRHEHNVLTSTSSSSITEKQNFHSDNNNDSQQKTTTTTTKLKSLPAFFDLSPDFSIIAVGFPDIINNSTNDNNSSNSMFVTRQCVEFYSVTSGKLLSEPLILKKLGRIAPKKKNKKKIEKKKKEELIDNDGYDDYYDDEDDNNDDEDEHQEEQNQINSVEFNPCHHFVHQKKFSEFQGVRFSVAVTQGSVVKTIAVPASFK